MTARVTAYSILKKKGRPFRAAIRSVMSTSAVIPAKGNVIRRKYANWPQRGSADMSTMWDPIG